MMWGFLANYGYFAIFPVELSVRIKLTESLHVCNFQLAGILAYFSERECIVVRLLDKRYTPCCILFCLQYFTLQ